MIISENRLKQIIKEEISNILKETSIFDPTSRDYDNNPYVKVTPESVKANKIFVPQWGNNGFEIDFNKAVKRDGGWVIPTGTFYQTINFKTASNASRGEYRNVFVADGNGQMIYAISTNTGKYDKYVGVGLTGGYLMTQGASLRLVQA